VLARGVIKYISHGLVAGFLSIRFYCFLKFVSHCPMVGYVGQKF